MLCGFNYLQALSRIRLLKADHCLAHDPRDDRASEFVWRRCVVCGGVVSRCPVFASFKTKHLTCMFRCACCAVTRDPVTLEHAMHILLGTPTNKNHMGRVNITLTRPFHMRCICGTGLGQGNSRGGTYALSASRFVI